MKLLILFILVISLSLAQNEIPELKLVDIPEGKIIKTEYYDGNSLWGYINGGADVYLEYGFDKLTAQQIEWKGYKFKIDIYQMINDEAVFGIFSIYRNKCNAVNSIHTLNCVTRYQLQVAIGKYYMSIVNNNGTEAEQHISQELLVKLMTRISAKSLVLPAIFNDRLFTSYKDKIKYIRGKLGFQNGYPDWEILFDNFKNYSIYLLPVETDSGSFNFSQIEFADSVGIIQFCKEIGLTYQQNLLIVDESEENKTKIFKQIGLTRIIYMETTINKGKVKSYIELIEKYSSQ